ncbi:MAG TPA: primosomal protein N' [Candidatus Dormibacteraeota bacterium]|nr:primosomal protein N' [Candidatus Dormibacteraeota bacterium]
MEAWYCDVALPVPLRTVFTYAIPTALRDAVLPGCRVVVPFGRRSMVGVVVGRSAKLPDIAQFKEIVQVLDPCPALSPQLLELGRWLADYYVAPPGEVFRAMLPPLVEVRTKRELAITAAGKEAVLNLSSRETLTSSEKDELAFLMRLSEAGVASKPKRTRKDPLSQAIMTRLMRRGWVESRERTEKRKGRLQKIVSWNAQWSPSSPDSSHLPESKFFVAIERIRHMLQQERGPLPLSQLLKLTATSRTFVERLIARGALESWEEPLDPAEDSFDADFTPPANVLNPEQAYAVDEIRSWLDTQKFTVGLLHGVTGSGKTEVYLRSIQETLARGQTALVLVPEIALTLWVGRQCRAWFGARFEGVAVLHSALSDSERAGEWWRVRHGEARVVVGTRSAVFAPLEKLGLIIVDEEQEASYKQEETPRYNGRDTAIVRAKLEGAVALLGSATPSLESYCNAQSGKYRLITLASRVANRPMARVAIVSLRDEFRQTFKTGPISSHLRDALAECLSNGTQALVLINRRGYSWFVLCRSCGAAVQCVNCSISMTYHKRRNRLACHYCGSSTEVPRLCPKCGSEHIHFFGEGSEQLEERLSAEFPDARIARLDRDTARSKREYQQILGAFASGQLDILVGTQMVAKGHDFHRVTLVGVVAADASLSLPDFRAAERTFQLLTQVAGRAGRGDLTGTVLVQTFYPEHYAIQAAAQQDYLAFFERELHFRKLMMYPPFSALANVVVRDAKIENAIRWSRRLAEFLAPFEGQGIRVLGPAAAPLARLKRDYRFQFLLKSPKRGGLTKALAAAMAFRAKEGIPEKAVLIDMDPLSLF